MSLGYSAQSEKYLIGTSSAAVNLTTSYADNSVNFEIGHFAEMTVYFEYTTGAGGVGNSVQFLFEGSPDSNENSLSAPIFYQALAQTVTAGVITLNDAYATWTAPAGGTTYYRRFYFPPADLKMKLSVKETIVAGVGGTIKVRYLLSGI